MLPSRIVHKIPPLSGQFEMGERRGLVTRYRKEAVSRPRFDKPKAGSIPWPLPKFAGPIIVRRVYG